MNFIKENKPINGYLKFVSFSCILSALLGQFLMQEFPIWLYNTFYIIGLISIFFIWRNYRNEIVKISIEGSQISFFKRKKKHKPYLKKKANKIGFSVLREDVKIGFISFNQLSYYSAIVINKKEWGENVVPFINALKELKVIESDGGEIKNNSMVEGFLDSVSLADTESMDIDLDIDIF